MWSPIPRSGMSTSTSTVPDERESTFDGPNDARTSCIWSFDREQQRGEPRDTLVAGPLGEQVGEGDAEAATLPLVDHRHRGLGAGAVVEANEAGDPDAVPGLRVEGDQRLVIVVVDVGEVFELRRRELVDRGHEPLVARLLAESPERLDDRVAILGADRANHHLRPVPEGEPHQSMAAASRP